MTNLKENESMNLLRQASRLGEDFYKNLITKETYDKEYEKNKEELMAKEGCSAFDQFITNTSWEEIDQLYQLVTNMG